MGTLTQYRRRDPAREEFVDGWVSYVGALADRRRRARLARNEAWRRERGLPSNPDAVQEPTNG